MARPWQSVTSVLFCDHEQDCYTDILPKATSIAQVLSSRTKSLTGFYYPGEAGWRNLACRYSVKNDEKIYFNCCPKIFERIMQQIFTKKQLNLQNEALSLTLLSMVSSKFIIRPSGSVYLSFFQSFADELRIFLKKIFNLSSEIN